MPTLSIWIQICIQVIAYIVIAVIFITAIRADVKILKIQMDGIKDNLKLLNDSMTKVGECLRMIAVQDTRITHIEDDIRDLKHGRGFIDMSPNVRQLFSGDK